MIYQRQLFSALAALYCLSLGIFVLYQNRKNPLNRSFGIFSICLGLWNSSDLIILFPPSWGIWHIRIFGIPGCIMIPYLVQFIYRLVEVDIKPKYQKIIKFLSISAGILSVLHLTPWILKDAIYEQYQGHLYKEVAGPLYPVFALFLLSGMIAAVLPIPSLLKHGQGVIRKQIGYILVSCTVGFIGLIVFFMSFTGRDYPFIYYSCELIFSFSFAYAIFKHNLIPVGVAIRRAMLLMGIYTIVTLLLLPITFYYVKFTALMDGFKLLPSFVFLILVGGCFALATFIYSILIQKASLFQDRYTTHLTHELKSPLSSIQAAQEILQDELGKPTVNKEKIEEYLALINRNTNRLQNFVGNVIEVNRPKINPEAKEFIPLNIQDSLHDALGSFSHLKERLVVSKEGNLALKAYPEGLRQIFINLISNAVKFCPEGEISVHLEGNDTNVKVSVKDRGAGLAPDDLKRVFDPYFKRDLAGTKTKGSGLGLTIVKEWVEAHNGKIWAESAGQAKGTAFYFYLPKNL